MQEKALLADLLKPIADEISQSVTTGVGDMIRKIIREEQQDKRQSTVELPIGLKGACEVTGLAKQTIYGRVNNGTIPHFKKGGKLYFMESELLEWLKSDK